MSAKVTITATTSVLTSKTEEHRLTVAQIRQAQQILQAKAVPPPHQIILSPSLIQGLEVQLYGMWQARTRRMSTLLHRAVSLVRRG